MTSARPRAFTIIELLVVIGIIALLAGIIIPSLDRAKDISRKVTCQANLKHVGEAFALFMQRNNSRLPAGYVQHTQSVWTDYLGRIARREPPADVEWTWFDHLQRALDTTGSAKGSFYCPDDSLAAAARSVEVLYPTVNLHYASFRANRGKVGAEYSPVVSAGADAAAFSYLRVQSPASTVAVAEGKDGRGQTALENPNSNEPRKEDAVINLDGTLDPPAQTIPDCVAERHLEGANYLWLDWHTSYEDDVPDEAAHWTN